MASSWTPGSSNNYNSFQPIDRLSGDNRQVTAPNISPDEDGHTRRGANAMLYNARHEGVGMWIDRVESSFGLSGTIGQGPTRRDFYPHNLVQPSITLHGQTPNQFQYHRLMDFIRQSHLDAVLDFTPEKPILRLILVCHSDAPKGGHGHYTEIDVEGFAPNAPKRSERFVNAPDYELPFIITDVHKFLGLEDRPRRFLKFQSITQALKNAQRFVPEREKAADPNGPNAPSAPGITTAGGDTRRPT